MVRNAQATRERLVRTAYEQIHEHGFQGMRVEQALKQAWLQKGAFYHHFTSKLELGYAVVEEEIKAVIETVWLRPMAEINNPVTDIPLMLASLDERATPLMKAHGCPLNNLAQEMTNLDDGFQQRLSDCFDLWIDTLAEKLEEAKDKNFIREDADSKAIARFIIAAIEGCISLSKAGDSKTQFTACHFQISIYLQGLRA